MTGPPSAGLVDDAERERISRTGLHETLFVEAGAGTGKTTQLVTRVTNLVLREGVPLRHIAAITFTEAAGAELRDRIRQQFEVLLDGELDDASRAAAEAALAESDVAAIGTLHSFALRILGEHPLDVGLPPRVEVLDEVSSQLAFEDRWALFLDELFDDPGAEELVVTASLLNIHIDGLPTQASLRDVAAVFSDNWDRLDPDEPDPGPLPALDLAPLRRAVDAVEALLSSCTDHDDTLYKKLVTAWLPQAHAILDNADPYQRVAQLHQYPAKWKGGSSGRKDRWHDVAAARAAVDDLGTVGRSLLADLTDDVLQRLRVRLAHFTHAEAERRRHEGRLEFHDLLVLARELVRTSPRARRSLHERYQRLLLDEFQDTDPIQIEVATRIAAALSDPVAAPHWADVPVEAGRIFFVGDPKQSIYRFRRADIRLFLQARAAFAGGEPVALVQNFRTVAPILEWVNHIFSSVMPEEVPTAQPEYRALVAARSASDHGDHRVVLLGGGRPKPLKAAELRAEEAADVARAIALIRDDPAAWPVEEERPAPGTPAWRPARLSDITVLLPTRTSLGQLEDALDDLAIPYRVDTGTLVYDTQEVRDALSALRAIDDPTDRIALVAALRSPLYACSDVDLFTYVAAGGEWSLRKPPPDRLPDDHPVVAGMAHLRELAAQRWWLEPSALLQRLFEDRQAFALGLGHRRPREVWRRLRFLVDQARQFEESGGHGLRAFLRWADLQSRETSRVHEPLLPETDDEAVSIKTVHGAKGLEFPITVVSGLTTARGNGRRGVTVVWDEDDLRPGIGIRKDTSTANFDRQAEYESEMDAHERQRLLYVACTRARDHLIVCTHHLEGVDCHGATLARCSADLGEEVVRRLPEDLVVGVPVAPPTTSAAPADDDRPRWRSRRAALLRRNRDPRVLSATAVARLGRLEDPTAGPPGDPTASAERDDLADEVVEDDATATDESGRPAFQRRRGRAGTAVGRAVHATLQVVDLATGDGLADLAAQQAFAEAVPDLAGTVETLARSALASASVRAALAGGRLWREAYVAAPLGDRAVEGYVDLLYEGPEGLVIVDYKTDAVADEAAVDAKLGQYRLQLATYAEALAISTGLAVAAARLVFCHAGGAIERDVDDLDAARAEVRALLAGSAVD
ncbi:MAG: UvrD-helicase domain-containing protein [Acidimicrobiales bacterium]|nr:UvrD-helicase domain-containing protein [Acidimicrobiales bacterium]